MDFYLHFSTQFIFCSIDNFQILAIYNIDFNNVFYSNLMEYFDK